MRFFKSKKSAKSNVSESVADTNPPAVESQRPDSVINLQEATNHSLTINQLNHVLSNVIGVNLQNKRCVHRLFDLDITDPEEDRRRPSEDGDLKISKMLLLSKFNSHEASSSPKMQALRPTKSTGQDSKRSWFRSGSGGGLVSDKLEVPTTSLNTGVVETHTKGSSMYQLNYQILKGEEPGPKIKITVFESNDKVFLNSTRTSSHRGSRVNRSVNSNLFGIDEELELYERNTRRDQASSDEESVELEGLGTVSLESGSNLQTFAVVVSIPLVETHHELPSLQPLTSDSSILSGEKKAPDFTETNIDLSQLRVSLNLICKILWNTPAAKKASMEPREEFLIGTNLWEFDLLRNYNYHILPSSPGCSSSLMSLQDSIITGESAIQPLRKLKLKSINEIKKLAYFDPGVLFDSMQNRSKQKFQYPPGDYIFVIPTIFETSLPETIRSPRALLDYTLDVSLKRYSLQDRDELSKRFSLTNSLKKISSRFTSNGSDDEDADITSLSDLERVSSVSIYRDDANSEDEDAESIDLSRPVTLYAEQKKVAREHLISKSVKIPVIRTPPDISLSVNKAVYVNKVWNDAISYEILLPNKYVRLNSEIPITINILPLDKNIYIKKIKVNILERVTYVSKDLSFQYDEGSKNRKDHDIKEIIAPLAELRTKNDGGLAIREDIWEPYENSKHHLNHLSRADKFEREKQECQSNNLLAFCYSDEASKKFGGDGEQCGEILIDRAVHINIPLFFKGIKSQAQESDGSGIFKSPDFTGTSKSAVKLPDDYTYLKKTEEELRVETQRSNTTITYGECDLNVKRHAPLSYNERAYDFFLRNSKVKQLHPDSNNFNFITVSHRLQVCFRICKVVTSELVPSFHQYEVIIDAPIILVSDLCKEDNFILPKYNVPENKLPTFEEATEQCLISPITSNYLDLPAYEEIHKIVST